MAKVLVIEKRYLTHLRYVYSPSLAINIKLDDSPSMITMSKTIWQWPNFPCDMHFIIKHSILSANFVINHVQMYLERNKIK